MSDAYEDKLKQIDASISKLRAKARKIKKEQSEAERKARNHRLICIAAEIDKCIEFDANTEEYDMDEWRAYLNTYGRNIRRQCIRPKTDENAEKENPAEQPEEIIELQPEPAGYQTDKEYKDFY